MTDPWVSTGDRFDSETRERWRRMEAAGIREHVRAVRRVGILLDFEAAVEELIELREAFGPESCAGLLR